MKSYIDWNELFPLLPKALRDTMLLEAVGLISAAGKRRTRTTKPVGNGAAGNAVLPSTLRTWNAVGDGKVLSAPGRHYKIVSSKPAITKGPVKDLWDKLMEYKSDTIAYESIFKMNKQDKLLAANHISYLWRTGRLEVTDGPAAQ